MSAIRISPVEATGSPVNKTPNTNLILNEQIGPTSLIGDTIVTSGSPQSDGLYDVATGAAGSTISQEASEGYPAIDPGSFSNNVANVSVGIQNAGFGDGNFPDNQAHTYIAIQWQDGGTTTLQSGPSSTGQLQDQNYPVNVGAQQTASADNGWTGAGTVNLSFPSQASANQFAQNAVDAYANYSANSATNPLYAVDGIDLCNTTTYDALIAAGQPLGAANDIMQSLGSQSGLNITGATFNPDVVSSMLDNTNNPQETFPTDPVDPQVDGGGTFTPVAASATITPAATAPPVTDPAATASPVADPAATAPPVAAPADPASTEGDPADVIPAGANALQAVGPAATASADGDPADAAPAAGVTAPVAGPAESAPQEISGDGSGDSGGAAFSDGGGGGELELCM